jgi:hypothetical protein
MVVHERSEVEGGGSEERLRTEDKGAIDLLRTTVRISKLGWRGC